MFSVFSTLYFSFSGVAVRHYIFIYFASNFKMIQLPLTSGVQFIIYNMLVLFFDRKCLFKMSNTSVTKLNKMNFYFLK